MICLDFSLGKKKYIPFSISNIVPASCPDISVSIVRRPQIAFAAFQCFLRHSNFRSCIQRFVRTNFGQAIFFFFSNFTLFAKPIFPPIFTGFVPNKAPRSLPFVMATLIVFLGIPSLAGPIRTDTAADCLRQLRTGRK